MRFIKDYARFENLSQGEFQSGFGMPSDSGIDAGQGNGAGSSAGQAPAPFSPGGGDDTDPNAPF
jgi:hypothetical protein